MTFELRPRPVFAIFALISLALLAAALAVQFFRGEAPCPLCVLQRAGFLLFGLIALVAAIHGPRRRGAAAYSAALEQIVNDLPTAKLLPWLFHASGDCAASHEPILGLQVPEWSLVWFGLLLVAAIFFAFKCLSAARAGAAD